MEPSPLPPVPQHLRLDGSLTAAISGLSLVLFLVLHLAAVSLALWQPLRFEALAAWLHGRLWLPPLELILAVTLLCHPVLALGRSLRARLHRGPMAGPCRSRRQGAIESLAARSGLWMPWSGGLLLLFVVVHLRQLRWPRPAAGAERAALLAALDSPIAVALYGLAGVALALHLLHGVESAHRSLGILEPANRAVIRWSGRALALLLGGGFALLPLALLLLQAHGGLFPAVSFPFLSPVPS